MSFLAAARSAAAPPDAAPWSWAAPAGPLAVWTRQGTAEVRGDEGRSVSVPAGTVLVDAGTRHLRVHAGADAVVLPIRLAGPGEPGRSPHLLPAPASGEPVLLRALARSLGYLRGGPLAAEALLAALRGGEPAPRGPRYPVSPPLREAALLLAGDGRGELGLGEVAERVGLSRATLHRGFPRETGVTAAAWARGHRLARARRALASGTDPEQVAHRAGYASAASLRRALRRDVPAESVPAPPAEVLEPISTWSHRNGTELLLWTARGGGRLVLDGRTTTLREGQLVTLPAGPVVALHLDHGATALPLCWGPHGSGPGWEERLAGESPADRLRRCVRVYVRGAGSPAGSGSAGGGSGDAVLDPLLTAVSTDPGRALGLDEHARALGMSRPALLAAFQEEVGADPRRWRARARMVRGRRLLADGEDVATVGRRLGYGDAAAFSRAFRRAHQVSPEEFARVQRGSPVLLQDQARGA